MLGHHVYEHISNFFFDIDEFLLNLCLFHSSVGLSVHHVFLVSDKYLS